jgi:hypothetical protein
MTEQQKKIKSITVELNKIFEDSNINITNMLKEKNIYTRTKELTFKDVINYKFQYSFKNKTQNNIINNYNYNNNKYCHKTAYYRKESKIPLIYYKNIYDSVLNIYNRYSKPNQYKIIAVDGTYNNTNLKNNKQIETTLNMGYYDITNEIPIAIDMKGYGSKNKEIEALITKIKNSEIDIENIIIVMDRGYCCYDLINFLDSKNIKYVLRIRNNCLHINNKRKKRVKDIPDNTRIITYNYNVETTKKLFNNKTKEYNDYKITTNTNCYIATNLNSNFTEDNIRNIYNSRWKIEEFFKLVKNNFKFSLLKEHNKNTEESYNKTYIIINIICILERIFELLEEEHINRNNQKYNIKINKTTLINGIYNIITDIIFSRLTDIDINKFFKCYIILNYCEKNLHNPRVSKIPFTKWYVKGYHSKYDIQQIFDALNDEGKTELNKNLKILSKNITFIKIE